MSAGTAGLDRLLGDPATLAAYWEDTPFTVTGLGPFDDVFGPEHVEHLLRAGALPVDSIRLFRAGRPLPVARVSRRRERGAGHREALADGPAVLREIADGATLVLEEVQTYLPAVDRLCRELTARTGSRTYCAAFLTPAGARGVPPHHDTAGVLLRQVHGSKRWRIGRPAERWPVREWAPDPAGDTPLDPVLDVVLRTGECLYIPRGYVHVGDATEEASVHLSVALKPVTWAAVLRPLLERALAEEDLREALPYAFHRLPAADLERRAADRAAGLARRLASDLDGGALKPVLDGARPDRPGPYGGTPPDGAPPDGALLRALARGASAPAPAPGPASEETR